MAWIYGNNARQAALNGICALLNGGYVRLSDNVGGAPGSELARPTFGSPAFQGATSASPSVNKANTLTADLTVSTGQIGWIQFYTSEGVLVKQGTVGTGGSGDWMYPTPPDFQVSDTVIPPGATSVDLTALQFQLTLGGV